MLRGCSGGADFRPVARFGDRAPCTIVGSGELFDKSCVCEVPRQGILRVDDLHRHALVI